MNPIYQTKFPLFLIIIFFVVLPQPGSGMGVVIGLTCETTGNHLSVEFTSDFRYYIVTLENLSMDCSYLLQFYDPHFEKNINVTFTNSTINRITGLLDFRKTIDEEIDIWLFHENILVATATFVQIWEFPDDSFTYVFKEFWYFFVFFCCFVFCCLTIAMRKKGEE